MTAHARTPAAAGHAPDASACDGRPPRRCPRRRCPPVTLTVGTVSVLTVSVLTLATQADSGSRSRESIHLSGYRYTRA